MTRPDEERDPLEVLAAEFVETAARRAIAVDLRVCREASRIGGRNPGPFPGHRRHRTTKGPQSRGRRSACFPGAPKLERLGDFRILGEIGRGGMGIVYEAFQESLGRHVAVKVLPRQSLLDPKHLQRFQRESQTAARLHHTNIVPVFGVGEQDGFHYIVMQLIRGVGLDAILAEIQQPDSASTAAQGEYDRTHTPQKSASEAVRLAEILFSGQFWKSKDSGILPFRSDEITESLEKNKTAATAGQSAGASAATEDFQTARSTEASRSPDSPGRVSITPPVSPETRRFGPAYWRSIAAIGLQVADALNYAHCAPYSAPRHQAGEPAFGLAGRGLDHRFRPGQGHGAG